MTDLQPTLDAAATWARIEAQDAARSRLASEALLGNKAALFDALADAGITSLVVTFDGAGDSGQIESIDPRVGEASAELPPVTIAVATPTWDGSALERRTLPLSEAIEALAFAFLAETHGGWEINEGAYGEFTFDVAAHSIALDYHERVLDTVYSGHEW